MSYELGCFFLPSFDYESLLRFLPLAKEERNYLKAFYKPGTKGFEVTDKEQQ